MKRVQNNKTSQDSIFLSQYFGFLPSTAVLLRSDCGLLLPSSCISPSVSFNSGPVGYQVVSTVKIRIIHLTKMCQHTLTTLACCPTCGALSPCSVLASVINILTAQPLSTLHRTSILELNELLLYASSPQSALACGQLGYHPDVKRSIVLCRIYQKTLH